MDNGILYKQHKSSDWLKHFDFYAHMSEDITSRLLDEEEMTNLYSESLSISKTYILEKGLSKYIGHEGDLITPIKKCLDDATRRIPSSAIKKTPLYMGATGGMKLLR